MTDKWFNYALEGYDPRDGLIGGEWVAGKNGIAKWVPRQPQPDPQRSLPVLQASDLLACVCGATVSETCKTASGNPTSPHKARVLERRCACGRSVSPEGRHSRYCEGCRITARRETYKDREIRTPTARRRAA